MNQPCRDSTGVSRLDNDTWNTTLSEQCATCKCENGYINCLPPHQCANIGPSCPKTIRREGACCDVCDFSHPSNKSIVSVVTEATKTNETPISSANSTDVLVPIAVGVGVSAAILAVTVFLYLVYKKRCSSNGLHSKVSFSLCLIYFVWHIGSKNKAFILLVFELHIFIF